MLVGAGRLLAPTKEPLEDIVWTRRDVRLTDPQGGIIFEQKDVEVPADWGEVAIKVAVHKYFFGIPGRPNREKSIKDLIRRVAYTAAEWAWDQSYFVATEEHEDFYADLSWILVNQIAAFNSPVWFNLGTTEKPAVSACFIVGVDDNLESIESLFTTEMEIFRRGSGSGVNFSRVRGSIEHLSKGGHAAGPLSFMKALDFSCGAMKSGGKARRGALMRILDIDHPDIVQFINLKSHAEEIAHVLIASGFDSDWENGIYRDIPWQNANNSVSIVDRFMKAVEEGEEWHLVARTTKQPVAVHNARDLLKQIATAAWSNGCPGVQFRDRMNEWNTCRNDDQIIASNPCSEYLWFNNTSCNLASINLLKCLQSDGTFNFNLFERVIRTMITAMDAFVDEAHYPTELITRQTKKYRTLGLGYANLGALLMRLGVPYDSEEGRTIAACITAFMHAVAYDQSAELARQLGAFERYAANAKHVRRVLQKHADACDNVLIGSLNEEHFYFSDALAVAHAFLIKTIDRPVRNAQVTVLAPTGTIGLLMGCDTTGVEPELALVRYKQMVGGGTERIVNQSVSAALFKLGYSSAQISEIVKWIETHESVKDCPVLKQEDEAVFATSLGANVISWQGHVKMMAAVQPFLSGGISKTINCPHEATPEDVQGIYELAYELNLKSIAIYRDGSKGSQPVTTKEAKRLQGILRKKLPEACNGKRCKFEIGGSEVYIHTGEFEDGSIGEIFITAAKSGSTLQGLLNSTAVAISTGLQYGVPLESIVKQYRGQKFEPFGPVHIPGNNQTRFYSSIVDAMAHWLQLTYLGLEISEEDLLSGSTPPCSSCGSLTVRNGTCFVCPQCGTTTGCS